MKCQYDSRLQTNSIESIESSYTPTNGLLNFYWKSLFTKKFSFQYIFSFFPRIYVYFVYISQFVVYMKSVQMIDVMMKY